ncbi:hypothetical protein BDP27DRAFT_426200 [Rhodocollybia butyracea]|uniref:Uncharacterized protein n=1 Tax=Rhodocollybia butyracea TaxID=206335 RepID=A0A9P5Q090_9AGAR|nr:hypothetical protein BDP27DRAFT_426200 [Rhodocollybia butyracea]
MIDSSLSTYSCLQVSLLVAATRCVQLAVVVMFSQKVSETDMPWAVADVACMSRLRIFGYGALRYSLVLLNLMGIFKTVPFGPS